MNKRLIIIGFILLSSFGFSQEKKTYSFNLEEAIVFALDSNYTSMNARRDIAKAIKQKWETTASGLPQINGEVNYTYNLKQPVTLIPGEFSGGEPGTYMPVSFGTKQSASVVATLNQLIFDGSYLVGLKAAKTFLKYSENMNEKTRLEVRKGVVNAYGSVLLAQELIDIFEKNKTKIEENLSETRATYENGLEEEESVEQLEITLLDLETQLENAKRSKSIAEQMFNLALGIDVETQVEFTDSLDALAQENISLALLDDSTEMENNVDFKIAENYTEQRYYEMQLEKSKALPSLSAFVNYGTSANNEDFKFFSGGAKVVSILGNRSKSSSSDFQQWHEKRDNTTY